MKMDLMNKNPALMSLAPKPLALHASPKIDMEKIEASAKEFEAMFVTEMMKPMFEGLEVNEMFGGGKGEEIFGGFMQEEYGRMIADTGQLGIADMVKQQMIEMQEKANNADLAQEMHGEPMSETGAL